MIPFTQFLMPDGRKRDEAISRPAHIEAMAKELLNRGCNFEIEMLSTGEISLEVMRGEESLAHELCSNGPAVPIAADSIVTQAFRISTDIQPSSALP